VKKETSKMDITQMIYWEIVKVKLI